MENLYFKQLEIGPMRNFIYLLGCKLTKKAAIVDPAWEPKAIIETIESDGYELDSIILTHGHHDHLNGVPYVKRQFSELPVYISAHESDLYTPSVTNLIFLQDGDVISVGNIEIETIHTPGHTPGCQCLKVSDKLITGDTLFINGCGRCDLPGGDYNALVQSLRTKIALLSPALTIYPGHHSDVLTSDTLANQLKTNPSLSF